MAGIGEDQVAQQAIAQVIVDEGGSTITDDPQDPGGRTKYGITQKLLSVVMPGRTVDSLSEAEATQIYYDHFWLEYGYDELAAVDQRCAVKDFNFCVTAGPKAATECLQRALRSCGVDIKDDGVMGPITRGMYRKLLMPKLSPSSAPEKVDLNETLAFGLICALKSEIAGWYRDLDKPRFEGGWVNRAYRG